MLIKKEIRRHSRCGHLLNAQEEDTWCILTEALVDC